MAFTALGIVGFISFLVFDLLSLRQHVLFKYVFLVLGIVLIATSSIAIVIVQESVVIPSGLRYIGLLLAIVFFMLLVYSVFIEVGQNTYMAHAKPRLVTNGTYSLVRHPGVIWLFLCYVFAALYFASLWLLLAAFVWTTCNMIYIILQERWILHKLFINYDTYRKSTPMIIPTLSSMKRFVTPHNWRKE